MVFVNNGNFSGNLGGDATQRKVGENTVTSFSMANTSPRGKKTTTWFRVSLWGRQGDNIINDLVKGQEVIVAGSISLESFTGKDGNERQSLELNATDVQIVRARGGDSAGTATSAVDDADDIF